MSSPTAKLQVRFFALLREQAGCATLEIESTATNAAALYHELQARYPGLRFPAHLLKVSINERYAAMDAPLRTGDRVVFIPPIAGG
jgi:sulfur-carrier protein